MMSALPLTEPRRVTFRVLGIPQSKGSTRSFLLKKAGRDPRLVTTHDNPRARSWEEAVRSAAQDAAGGVFFDAAVTLSVEFAFTRPKSVSARQRPFMTARPDLDKTLRSVADGLTGVLYRDDAQIIAATVTKRYVDGPSGALITIEEVRT